ncbi:MAG: rhodanese-like domain-containing protein [Deltaproteobacteria bacterium]|nr:rhodanese-like domain-containing protein [Deltaproteobacteria bacterium]
MRTLVIVTVLGFSALGGCTKSADKTAVKATAEIPTITIDQLDTMLAKSVCVPVDANGERTRQKMGVIPGAVLLTDSETFTPAELPADKAKTLVFYCANTSCGASHEAAAKALTAGYTDVKVLPDGIAGWVKAGKKIQSI